MSTDNPCNPDNSNSTKPKTHPCKDVLRKGTSERAAGMTYVALSRVRRISHLVIEPMTFEQLKAVKKNSNFKYRKLEELCLCQLARKTLQIHNAKQF
jgi:hypothetical protein